MLSRLHCRSDREQPPTANDLNRIETTPIRLCGQRRESTHLNQTKGTIMNVSSTSSISNSAQEALETAAQTKAEAAKGDQQAIRKLAHTASNAANGATTNSP